MERKRTKIVEKQTETGEKQTERCENVRAGLKLFRSMLYVAAVMGVCYRFLCQKLKRAAVSRFAPNYNPR